MQKACGVNPTYIRSETLVGCEHNLSRQVMLPEPETRIITARGKERSVSVGGIQPGQFIKLVCPKGCRDVLLTLGHDHE